ncbi:hypothetical protein ACOSQ4_024484 [Xanthoceras sorbifolium]
MATARTIIDLQHRKLSMTVLGETVKFQRELEEKQHLSSRRAEDDPETGLGVKKKLKRQEEPKLCPNKSLDSKPKFDENGGRKERQLQLMGDINRMRREQSRQERIAGHATNDVLDVQ